LPRNGSGQASLAEAPFVPGTTIESAPVNDDFADIISMLTDSLAADGQTTMTGGIQAFPGAAGAPAYTWASSPTDGFFLSGTHQIGLSIAGSFVGFFNANGFNTTAGQPTGVPIGAVQDFAGTSAPLGWYLCYGQNVSRTTYALLFAIIGTTYGAGDGLTTFGLPDCRGRTTSGQDNMGGTPANRITVAGGNFDGTVLGNSGGAQNQTLVTANLAAHVHSLSTGTVAVTDPGHTHTHTDPGHTHANGAGTTGFAYTSGGGSEGYQAGAGVQFTLATASSTTGVTNNTNTTGITAALSGSSGSAGSASAFADLSPTIIFNKIIFAGA
jgi:microcystin-dependent protein